LATIFYRRATRKVYVYYFNKKEGKAVQVPRKLVKHLDGEPPAVVEAWVAEWEAANGIAKDKIDRFVLKGADKAKMLWEAYQTNRMRVKKRQTITADAENDIFEMYIAAYFVGTAKKKDPTRWHQFVPDFHNWLYEKPISDAYRRKILWALERFGNYLVYSRVMNYPFAVQTPTRNNTKITPLKVTIDPKELIQTVCSTEFKRKSSPKKHATPNKAVKVNFKLAVLLGYFASLRPEELYALERKDFLTGKAAAAKSTTREGLAQYGLGSKLVVIIDKALKAQDGKVAPLLKTAHSYGYVTVWYPDAAKVIAEMLMKLPEGRLFPFSRGYLDRAWREIVHPIIGATAHDLRRASGLYLGRVVRIKELTLLQEHLRHAEIETTELYMRSPPVEREDKSTGKQDFDDVV